MWKWRTRRIRKVGRKMQNLVKVPTLVYSTPPARLSSCHDIRVLPSPFLTSKGQQVLASTKPPYVLGRAYYVKLFA